MRSALAVALCLVVTVCDNSTGPKENHVGTYGLQTIGGKPLPYVLFGGVDKTEILALNIQLNSDWTYEVSATSRYTINGEVTTETEKETGQYTLIGTTLTLTRIPETGGGTDIGTLAGRTITITDLNGDDWVFVKV